MKKTASKIIIRHPRLTSHFLMVKSNNYWSLPGGKMEQNELPIETLYRELDEELPIVNFKNLHHAVTVEGDNWRIHLYQAIATSREIKIGSEIVDYRWVPFRNCQSAVWDTFLRLVSYGIRKMKIRGSILYLENFHWEGWSC